MEDAVQLGPFRVDEQIGEGGMGTVYRGSHRETDQPVAIKVIHRQTDAAARRQFHREVQAHASLVHSGIVYLFEYGAVESERTESGPGGLRGGSPYVAMELADGGTVADGLPGGGWATICRLLVQVLDALAYSHARGVIHRDLKPENLLLFDSGGETGDDWRVKIADFGIAHAFRQEDELETPELQEVAGTPLYMAPEQVRARWRAFGPWTDLYALGCIAWHLVCGRPPFVGDSALATAIKHGTEERPPLEPQFPVPDGLEGWIHRAMAQSPDRRFRRAADALWALPRGVLAEDARDRDEKAPADGTLRLERTRALTLETTVSLEERSETEESGDRGALAETAASAGPMLSDTSDREAEGAGMALEPSHPPVPDAWRPEQTEPLPAPLVGAGLGLFGLREPPFVDRERECDRIWEALQHIVERGGGRTICVTGGTGTGKSRLVEWMARRAHEVGAASVIRAVHAPGGGPGEGLRGAMERTLRTSRMDREEVYEHLLDRLPQRDGERDGRHERDARALTEYLRPTETGAETVGGPRYRLSNAGQRRALIARVLDRLADRRPVILWLDDLQWGIEAIGLLEHLHTMPGEPEGLLVLATLRSDLVPERPAVEPRLAELEEAGAYERIALDPLPARYQRELLEGLLPLEETLADQVIARTEGHPLFAMQLLGHWIERGDLEVGPQGFRAVAGRELALPDDIHELWTNRLDQLLETVEPSRRDAVREALVLAAALGREVDDEEWAAVLADAGRERPDGLVDELVERGLAERTNDGWSFAHGMLIESLARRAREAGRWQVAHRRCARMLETRTWRQEPGPRTRVADHWVEAGEPERALAPLLAEIKLWDDRDDDEQRRQLLDWRGELLDEIGVPADDSRRLEQRVERAKMIADIDDRAEAEWVLSEVWERIPAGRSKLRGRAANLLALVENGRGNQRQALEWGERALEACRDSEAERLQGQSHLKMGWLRFDGTEFRRAEKHAERVISLAERSGDRYLHLEARRLRATIHDARSDEDARALFEEIQRDAAEAGFVTTEAAVLNGLGENHRFDGQLDEARRYYRRFLRKMTELARPFSEAIAHLNLAQVELKAARFERAREHLQSAEQHFEAIGAGTSRTAQRQLIRLGRAAGVGDESAFRSHWAPLQGGWPREWRLVQDHAWLLETAADYAERAGWHDEAREVFELARDLWNRLGDEEAADRLDARLSR